MINWDDFDKIWARTSPLTPYQFSDSNYEQGWNFVGATPPSRQMWDYIQKQNDEKFKYLRDNFGTPNMVTSSSQMTDTEKVYVYMGSEAGWNSGHWYYYDEGTSSWADGGVYNSVAFVTDTTLSIAGQPADAKETGDALALKSDLAGCTFTGNVSVNADLSVTGDASIGTDLSVAGASTLTGNVSAGADITVVGDVSSANITASNNATIGGNATVTGSVASASLTTTADATIGGNLSVGGTTILTGDVSASADLSVAGDSSLTNLSVSGTTALAGTSTAPTPSADDNSTKIATTEYVQTELKPIEVNADITDKRISNIEKLLQGNLYDYQTDTDSAYTKTVPSGAMPYAGLEQIGGKTIIWNQLMYDPTMTSASNWKSYITPANFSFSAADNVLTIERVASGGTLTIGSKNYEPVPVSGHKYYMSAELSATTNTTIKFNVGGNYSGNIEQHVTTTMARYEDISTTSAGDSRCGFVVTGTYGVGDKINVKNFCVFDLTLMFGNGNEPTLEQCNQMFAGTVYPYNAGTLLSAGVTEVVSKKADTTTIATYPIPAEIQALEGYGWSAGTVYNYIDYEAKKFIQNVGSRAYASGDESDSTVITDMTTTYYPLNPAVETDISAYITDDNLIEVEAGGTLTFENQNGDDYRIPVPSAETYMVDLQSAI